MRYVSTRGATTAPAGGLSFEQSLFSGYASDGGMLLPERVPLVPESELARWSQLHYSDLVFEISSLFISPSEIPSQDLKDVIQKAFSGFDISDVVSYRRLESGLNMLELFHGKTAAFKDLALCCVGSLMQYFLERQRRHVTVLVGTSGDTGSAAIEAVRSLNNVDIIVLLPRGRCTEIQELQMTTAIANNVHVYRVDGTSDELDFPVKQCFADQDYVHKHGLCSINSLNWSRIMIQIAHYFYAYFQAVRNSHSSQSSSHVTVVVPTGALGNLTAGCIAQKMGLPLRLVAAVTNATISRALDTGLYSAADLYTSLACAINIQVPYNWERLLYLFSNGNGQMVADFMLQFERHGSATVPAAVLAEMRLAFETYVADNERIVAAIRRCWQESKYLLCPHTAVAVSFVFSRSQDECSTNTVVLGVASHAKFPEVLAAAGVTQVDQSLQTRLRSMPTCYQDMERNSDWFLILKSAIEDITSRRAASSLAV